VSRRKMLSVRSWVRAENDFVEKAAASGSLPPEPVLPDVRNTLLSGLVSKVIDGKPARENQPVYRVFATTFETGKPAGAVEIVERFDSIWSIAFRYVRSVVWMSLMCIVMIQLGTYMICLP